MRSWPVRCAVALVLLAALLLAGLEGRQWLDSTLGGKADDLAYVLVAATPFLLGAVTARWWWVAFAGAVFVLSVLAQQAVWRDDPQLTGIDDIPPVFGLIGVPVPMILAALGVIAGRLARGAGSLSAGRRRAPAPGLPGTGARGRRA